MNLSLSTSIDLLPVALFSIYFQFKSLQRFIGITKFIPSIIESVYFLDSFNLASTTSLMNSYKFPLVNYLFFPPGINSTSSPFESNVVNFSSTAAAKSSSLSPIAVVLKSSITYHEYVSKAFRSISFSVSFSERCSSRMAFQKIGARSNGSDYSLLIAIPK